MNNTNNIVKPFANNSVSLSSIAIANAARKAAEEEYKKAKQAAVTEVVDFLKAAPEGTTIRNTDLARAARVTPLHMAGIMADVSCGFRSPVTATTVYSTTTYAEVDENGALIENGRKKVVRSKGIGYVKNPSGK